VARTAGLRARHRALGAIGATFGGRPPALDATTWEALVDLTDQHHLTAALRSVLRRCPGHSAPEAVQRRLEMAYRQNFGRSMRIGAQLRGVVTALNSVGVVPAPLKGALHLLEGTYAHPAERVMADLDLLVAPSDVAPALEALESAGYRSPAAPGYGVPHETLHFASGQPVPVELHAEIGSRGITHVLTSAAYLNGRAVTRDGLTYRSADPAHVVLHNVLHAQIQDRNYRVFGLPLRQLHTLTAYVRHQDRHIDWPTVCSGMARAGETAVLEAYLDLARRFMALPAELAPRPTPALRARRAACMLNAELGGRPGDAVRNLRYAFGPDYLRDRYGSGRPLAQIRVQHAANLWRARGKATISEAADGSPWR
jgi:hypothetical protein